MADSSLGSNLSSSAAVICPRLPLSISGVEYEPTGLNRGAKLAVCLFNSFTSPLAVLANSLVFVAILRKKSLRSVHNTSVLCLAFADLLVAMVAQPCFVSFHAKSLLLGRVSCSVDLAVYAFGELVCAGLSFLTLTLITAERYLAIFHPYSYREHATKARILGAVGATWLVWVTYASVVRFSPGIDPAFYTAVPGLLISANFIATLFVYSKVIQLTRRCNHTVGAPPYSLQAPGADASETRRSKTIAYISLALLGCFTPVFIASVLHQARLLSDHVAYHVVYPAAESAVFFNSLLNPLIYVWRDQHMRTSFAELCKPRIGLGV